MAPHLALCKPLIEPGIHEAAMASGKGTGENMTVVSENYREDESKQEKDKVSEQQDIETQALYTENVFSESASVGDGEIYVAGEILERAERLSESGTRRETEVSVGVETLERTNMCSEAGTVKESDVTVGIRTLEGAESIKAVETCSEIETVRGSVVNFTVATREAERLCSRTRVIEETDGSGNTGSGNTRIESLEINCIDEKRINQEECISEQTLVVSVTDSSQGDVHHKVCSAVGSKTVETSRTAESIPHDDFGVVDSKATIKTSTGKETEERRLIALLASQNHLDVSQSDRHMDLCISSEERIEEMRKTALATPRDGIDVSKMDAGSGVSAERKIDLGVIGETEVLGSKIEALHADSQLIDGERHISGTLLLQKEGIAAKNRADNLNEVSKLGKETKEKREDAKLEGIVQVEAPPNAVLSEGVLEPDCKQRPIILSQREKAEKTQVVGFQLQHDFLSVKSGGNTDSGGDQQDRELLIKEIAEKVDGQKPIYNVNADLCAESRASEGTNDHQGPLKAPKVARASLGERNCEASIYDNSSQSNALNHTNIGGTDPLILAKSDKETNTDIAHQILKNELPLEGDNRRDEVGTGVESRDVITISKEAIKEGDIGGSHEMEVDASQETHVELCKTNAVAFDTENNSEKERKKPMLVEDGEKIERVNDVYSTFAVHMMGKSSVDAATTEGTGKISTDREITWNANCDMQVRIKSQDLVTTEEVSKVEEKEEELVLSSGKQFDEVIMKQLKKIDDVNVGEGSIPGSFKVHNKTLVEGRFGDGVERGVVLEENKIGISDEGNMATSEENKYAGTRLEKGEISTKASQKRKASENHVSDSGSIMNGQSQSELSVKKAKKKPVNVWAKSSTSRKGSKKNSKNAVQPNTAKEDAVFLTPVFVNQDKVEDGSDQPIALSKTDKAEKIELSENRLSASSTKGYRMVRATRGVQEGTWYFEILIEQLGPTGHTRLGWSTQKGDVQAPVGFDSNSYGYRDVDGSKVHVAVREPYGDPYIEGDVIGFYIHLPNGTEFSPKPASLVSYRGRPYISETKDEHPKKVPGSEICFFRNGVCQGTAFKDINGGRYFPAASMYTMPKEPNCTVKFNFGPHFQYPPQDGGTRPPPMAMCFAPYHNGMGDNEIRATPLVNDSSSIASIQHHESHAYGSM